MTNEEAVSILESWNWRFAKSMPNIPHSYARKSDRSRLQCMLKIMVLQKDFTLKHINICTLKPTNTGLCMKTLLKLK